MHHRRGTVFWTLGHVTIDLKQLLNPLVALMLSGGKILDHHCLSSNDNKGSCTTMHWSLTLNALITPGSHPQTPVVFLIQKYFRC